MSYCCKTQFCICFHINYIGDKSQKYGNTYQWAANGLHKSKWKGTVIMSRSLTDASTYTKINHKDTVAKQGPRSK